MKFIYHISDIHIKNGSYNNIRFSFDKLVIDMLPHVHTSILVIAGDIFENKTYLNTDDLYIFFYIMDKLETNNINTLIMPGNHDYNINSKVLKNNIDILLKKYKYIKCISATKNIRIDNINFGFFSPIDKLIPSIDNSLLNVAILHEPINDAKYDTGEVIQGFRFSKEHFDNWDYVLLGDIHKPQFIKHNIAYSGSFVQKNKGEGIDHGYILWDLENKNGKHVFIPLLEINLKLEAYNDTCDLPDFSKHQRIKYITLVHHCCSSKYLENIKHVIENKYDRSINKVIEKNNYIRNLIQFSSCLNDEEKKELDIDTTNILNNILIEQKTEETMKNLIISKHNEFIQNRNVIQYTNYTLNYLLWSNVLCYGENNYIDFRNFKNDIIVLNGNNKIGKSSIIDILIRILFNECYRGHKDDIVNKEKNKGSIKLSLNIHSDEYIIEQIIYTGNVKKVVHRLYKNKINITQSTINETYKYLKEIVGLGDYKYFVNMTTALQNRSFLVDMDKKDIHNLFTKILDMDMFIDLEKTISEKIREVKRAYKEILQERDFFKSKININDINNHEKQLALLNTEEIDLLKEEEILQKDLQKLYTQYDTTSIPENIEDLISNAIKYKYTNIDEIIEYVNSKITIKDPNNKINTELYINNTINDLYQKLGGLKIQLPKNYKPSNKDNNKFSKNYTFTIEDYNNNKEKIIELEKIINSSDYQNNEVISKAELENKEMYADFIINKKKYNVLDYYKNIKDCEITTYYDNIGNIFEKEHELELNELKSSITKGHKIINNLTFCETCECCNFNKELLHNFVIHEDILNTITEAGDVANTEETQKINRYFYLLKLKQNSILHYNNNIEQSIKEYEEYEEKLKLYEQKYNMILCYENIQLIQELKQQNINFQNSKIYEVFCKIEDIKNEIHMLEKYVEKIHKYKQYQSLLNLQNIASKNTKIKETINILNKKINDIKYKQDVNKKAQINILEKINVIRHNTNEVERLTNKVTIFLQELEWMEKYYNCIEHKKGIPSVLLRNICNLLSSRINTVLTKITDFSIKISYDKEFQISTVDQGKIIPADMSSGFQKFIIDIIMRIVLTNISVLGNSNILFIDEGFGCLDKENFVEVSKILQTLKYNFSAIVIITHISELKSYADKIIDVKKLTKFSSIQYGELTDTELAIELKSEIERDSRIAKEFKENKIICPVDTIPEIIQSHAEKLVEVKENTYYCRACKIEKKMSLNAIKKHLSSKSYQKKHDKYISIYIS